jgi:hypothetical protein
MQEQAPQAPTPPTPAPVQVFVDQPRTSTSADVYQAFRAQSRELKNQLNGLEEKRRDLSQELQQVQQSPSPSAADRAGLEARIREVDARILNVEKEIAAADAQVARAAAVPGATIERPEPRREGPPEEAFVLGGIFIVVVFFPLSVAYARRIWRRGAAAITQMPKELGERFTRLEQAVDAIAVEVERVGEGQRYMSRVVTDDMAQRALGAGPAMPIELREREAAHLRRER